MPQEGTCLARHGHPTYLLAMEKASGLAKVLSGIGSPTIAVSGGVDSTTLAEFASRHDVRTTMVHAASPAVPAAATARVRTLAQERGWRLRIVDAGEFGDERYLANPINRCFYCKSNLYQTLGRLTDGPICSGANVDDLGDFRPGLDAAADHGVRHPYIEAGFAKKDIRALARTLDLPELSALPASPCLASRLETGIRVEPRLLRLVESVEAWVQARLTPKTVRCRIRPNRIEVELDPATRTELSTDDQALLLAELRGATPDLENRPIQLSPYHRGSAFIRDKGATA